MLLVILKIEQEISNLKDALARNPVGALIEKGLLPSIVEDLADESDKYSRKSEFVRDTKEMVEKVNPLVRSVAKQVYMTHDTESYQTLSHITQLSDFVGRFVLYQHLITQREGKMTSDEAIHEVSEAFISYDTPMHPKMQWMDDTGLFMFSKYFIRIQRVIRNRVVRNPARTLMLATASSYFDWLPNMLMSSMFTRIGNNPLHAGAANYIGAVGELPAFSIFK